MAVLHTFTLLKIASSLMQPCSVPLVVLYGLPIFPDLWQCLKKEEATQASMRNVQVAGGTVLNDRVAVFNAFAAQEDSGWKSRSDHDVVLVPLCWRLHTPAKTARPVVPKVTAAHTGPWPRRSNTANGSA